MASANSLAVPLRDRCEFEKARALNEEAMLRFDDMHDNHPEILNSIHSMGKLLYARGQL